MADTNVSALFARARNISCGQKLCPRHKNVSDFFSETFCVHNKCFPVCSSEKHYWQQNVCRDIPLRNTARARARVVLITSLISANQMLCMIIWIFVTCEFHHSSTLSTRTVCIFEEPALRINHLKLFRCCLLFRIDLGRPLPLGTSYFIGSQNNR